jgi:hypothetical protein
MSRLSTKQRRARTWRRLLVRLTDEHGCVSADTLFRLGIDHREFLRRGYYESITNYWLVRGPPPRRVRWVGNLVCEHPGYQGLAAWLPSAGYVAPPMDVEKVLLDAWEFLKREDHTLFPVE